MDNSFGGDPMAGMAMGPSISGKWFNKRTGKSIVVRDNFISDDGLQVMTSTGDMISGDEFSRDYIQVDDNEYDMSGNITGKAEKEFEVPEQVDYEAMFNTPSNPIVIQNTNQKNIVVNENTSMIDKLFSKLKSTPSVNADLVWDNIPTDQLNMLINFFDVSIDDIASYIYNKYYTEADVKEAIAKTLTSLIQKSE